MPSLPPPAVLWLPSHPAAGVASMDRYWNALERERRTRDDGAGPVITNPLGDPPTHSTPGGWWVRAWRKYVDYPRKVRRASRRSGIKVAHVLDQSFAHLLTRVPPDVYRIATVHDLAPLRGGASLSSGQVARFRRVVEHVRLADLILADSRHSADEAIALLALAPEKVRVLPLGVDVALFARNGDAASATGVPPWRERWTGRRVILSVGSAVTRKNLASLPAIFRALGATEPGMRLALLRVGEALPGGLSATLRETLGDDGLLELGTAPDHELIAAYQHADALIFPSRIEGFGFPLLEAMAAGCPVVSTNVTSLPEVGGDAALYFDPDDPAAAAAHLTRLFTDERWRRDVVTRGRVHADKFLWRTHFDHLLDIYRGLT